MAIDELTDSIRLITEVPVPYHCEFNWPVYKIEVAIKSIQGLVNPERSINSQILK